MLYNQIKLHLIIETLCPQTVHLSFTLNKLHPFFYAKLNEFCTSAEKTFHPNNVHYSKPCQTIKICLNFGADHFNGSISYSYFHVLLILLLFFAA